MENDVKVGDIFYASWGYDQTNIDFVKVIGISQTGKTVTCRRVEEIIVDNDAGFMAEMIKPGNEFGDIFRLKIDRRDGHETTLRGSYPFCHDMTAKRRDWLWKWEGKPMYQSHCH